MISHIVSGLLSNSVAEILGRKKSIIIDCLAFLFGYSLYSIGENVASLIVAQLLLGYPLINTVRWQLEKIICNMRYAAVAVVTVSNNEKQSSKFWTPSSWFLKWTYLSFRCSCLSWFTQSTVAQLQQASHWCILLVFQQQHLWVQLILCGESIWPSWQGLPLWPYF